MFIKLFTFNIWAILAIGLGAGGAAVILAGFGWARYFGFAPKGGSGEGRRIPSLKAIAAVGAGMIALALLALPVGRKADWMGERYLFRDGASYEASVYAGAGEPADGPLDLATMPASRKYAFRRGELIMTRNGYVETPVWSWPSGRYELELELKGKAAEGRPPEILAAFLAFSGRRLTAAAPFGRREIGPETQVWRYGFSLEAEAPGKVRVQFLNAKAEKPKLFREVRITRAEIRRLGPRGK